MVMTEACGVSVQEIEEANQEKEGEENKHKQTSDHLNELLEESKSRLEELDQENHEIKQRCKMQEGKIQAQDRHQENLEKKFEQWEKAFKAELEKSKEKADFYRQQMEGDQKVLTDKIEAQEEEIAELKLKLTSKEMELENNDLHYDDLNFDEEGEPANDDEESKYGLQSEFNRTRNDSQIEVDESGEPLLDNELQALGSEG